MVAITKKYHCNPCGKVFSSKFKLRSHLIKIKTGAKYYKCNTCLLEFSRKYTLDIHESLHEKSKAINHKIFKCKLCSRTFKESSALDGHMAVHSNKSGLNCGKCLMIFLDKKKLKLHIVKKHEN